MIGLGIIGVLGVCIDILIWPATTAFWRVFVHSVAIEEKADSAWTLDIAWTLLDGAFAVLIMGGIGFVVALAIVSTVATAFGRR